MPSWEENRDFMLERAAAGTATDSMKAWLARYAASSPQAAATVAQAPAAGLMDPVGQAEANTPPPTPELSTWQQQRVEDLSNPSISKGSSMDDINAYLSEIHALERNSPEAYAKWAAANPEMSIRYDARMANKNSTQGTDLSNKDYKKRAQQTAFQLAIDAGYGEDAKKDGKMFAHDYKTFKDVNNEWGKGDFWKLGTAQTMTNGWDAFEQFVSDKPLQAAGMLGSAIAAPYLAGPQVLGLTGLAQAAATGAIAAGGSQLSQSGDIKDLLKETALGAASGAITYGGAGKIGGVPGGFVSGAGKETLSQAVAGDGFDLGAIAKAGGIEGAMAGGKDFLKDAANTRQNEAILEKYGAQMGLVKGDPGYDEFMQQVITDTNLPPAQVENYLNGIRNTSDVGKLFGENALFGGEGISTDPFNRVLDTVSGALPDWAAEGLQKLLGSGKSWDDMTQQEKQLALVGGYDERFFSSAPRGDAEFTGIHTTDPTGQGNTFTEAFIDPVTGAVVDAGNNVAETLNSIYDSGGNLVSNVQDMYDRWQAGATNLTPESDKYFQEFMSQNPTASIDTEKTTITDSLFPEAIAPTKKEQEDLIYQEILQGDRDPSEPTYVPEDEVLGSVKDDSGYVTEDELLGTSPIEGETTELPTDSGFIDNPPELTESTTTTTTTLPSGTPSGGSNQAPAPSKRAAARKAERFRLARIMEIEGLDPALKGQILQRLVRMAEEDLPSVEGDVTKDIDPETTAYLARIENDKKKLKRAERRKLMDPADEAIMNALRDVGAVA